MAAELENLVVLESPNHYSRMGLAIEAIVDHIAQGTQAGLDATLCDPCVGAPERAVSAHFAVMKNGAIHQYVSEELAAWGAGRLNRPDESLPWLPPPGATRGRQVNAKVISIEHEGHSGELLTPEQFASTVRLHRYLIARWNIPVDRDHIIGHYRLDSVDRKGCPGPGFPWDQLFEALQQEPAVLQQESEASQQGEETMNQRQIDELNRVTGIILSWASAHRDRAKQAEALGFNITDSYSERIATELEGIADSLKNLPAVE